ncbi:Uncharacterised protein [uncultured archaeon]|nr:Uncharacterised protein [uncultured archaeon]
MIADAKPTGCRIDVKCSALLPEQVLNLKIPMIKGGSSPKEKKERYKRYLQPHALDPRKVTEIDALEVYYPGGIAGFLDNCLGAKVL